LVVAAAVASGCGGIKPATSVSTADLKPGIAESHALTWEQVVTVLSKAVRDAYLCKLPSCSSHHSSSRVLSVQVTFVIDAAGGARVLDLTPAEPRDLVVCVAGLFGAMRFPPNDGLTPELIYSVRLY
jgi:hypothetical protein